jgi:hypothetical protein
MLYQQIEGHIRKIYSTSSLDDWIVDCGKSIYTKIIAFNLFCEFHYETLPALSLLDCAIHLENKLQNVDRKIDPIDRIKGLVSIDFPYWWDSKETNFSGISKITRIIEVDRLKKIISNIKGTSFSRTTYFIDDAEVERLIEEFKYYLSSGFKIELTGYNGLVWFSPSSEIKSCTISTGTKVDLASIVRDLLGLDYRLCYLIQLEFEPDLDNLGIKPTVFHSDFRYVWLPISNFGGWGITLNLGNLKKGVRESIRKKSLWPDCDFLPLGNCNSNIRLGGLDDYYKERVIEFKTWANGDTDILADIEHFFNKWKV